MSYKGTRKPLAQIARELNVDAVVEGTVLRSAGRVRITAQLIRANPESHLWAESYERDLLDVLTLQGEVARDIAGEVSAKLVPEHRKHLAGQRAVDPEVHGAYLKGLYHTARYTEEEIQKGIAYFSQAVQKDPGYAPAYASLARAYTLLSTYYLAPREVMPKARAAAMRALELDETLAEAHTSLGNVRLFYDWDWLKASQEFKRAIELNPNSADAHDGYANYLVAMGRHEESLAESKRAIELDPLSLVINADAAGNGLYFSRKYEQAIELCRKTIEFDPNFGLVHFYMAQSYAQTGQFGEALVQARTGYQLDSSPVMTGLLGEVYAFLGERAETEKVLERLNRLSKRRYVCSYETAAIYQGLGHKDAALKWLSRAYSERSDCIPWLKVDPAFDALRSDPRFQDLVRRSGLPL
jgi:tetratricopeptide (TPR) repeat protein